MSTHKSYCLWCGDLVACTDVVLSIRGLCQLAWPAINFCSLTCYNETKQAMEKALSHEKILAEDSDNYEAQEFLSR